MRTSAVLASTLPEAGLARREMPALTSIRALLAWWVVAFHLLVEPPFGLSRSIPLLGHGWLAVDCFFVLSGFVLCHVHPVIIGSRSPHAVADFLVSRLARIYPLHLVMLAAFALVVVSFDLLHPGDRATFRSDTLPALARQLLLLHGWLYPDMTAWNVPSWSISSEWVAYLTAPVLFLWLRRQSRVVLAAMLAGLGGLTVILLESGLSGRTAMAIPRVLLEFAVGALMRSLLEGDIEPLCRIRPVGLMFGWSAAVASAFWVHPGVFLAAMTWVMLLLSLRTQRAQGWPGRIERVTIYLGETSFAVYLCHAFIGMIWGGKLRAFLAHGPLGGVWASLLLLVVLIQSLASILHHAVERPAQRAIRGWFRTRVQCRS